MMIVLIAMVLVGSVTTAIAVRRWAVQRRETLSDDRIRAIAQSVKSASEREKT